MDKAKHTNVRYLTSKSKMSKTINSFTFKAMEELNHDIFEVETYKSHLNLRYSYSNWIFHLTIRQIKDVRILS